MNIAALQMVSGRETHATLATAHTLLAQAHAAGAELAVLPEYFACMGLGERAKLAQAETFGSGPVQDFLARSARQWGMWIVGGTLALRTAAGEPGPGEGESTQERERVTNTCLVYDPSGACVARYDKIHLFQFDNGHERYAEADTVQPGQQPVTVQVQPREGPPWRLGLSVCYDLRFPELYRALAQAGADVLLVPSAFTATTGQAHWESLLRARAIENLAYVLAPAQGGTHDNGRRTWGHSLFIDPWGEVLAQHAHGPGLVLGQLQRARLDGVRAQLPALTHRVL